MMSEGEYQQKQAELAEAIVAVSRAIKNPVKDSNNPFFKSKYASLGAVIDTAKELLHENGLAILQESEVGHDGKFIIVKTHLMHESGASLTTRCAVPMKEYTPQGGMSAFTYGRRYALLALFNLAAEDDDGNEANANGKDSEALNRAAEAVKNVLGTTTRKGTL